MMRVSPFVRAVQFVGPWLRFLRLSRRRRPNFGRVVLARPERLEARWLLAGQLDTTFGAAGDGRVVTTFDDSGATCTVMQPDGKLVVAGTSHGAIAMARYDANGRLDTSFDSDGRATFALGDVVGLAVQHVSLQGDGKLVVLGTGIHIVGNSQVRNPELIAVRFNVDGSFDFTYTPANGGVLHLPRRTDTFDAAIQTDGKIVAADLNSSSQIVVSRFNADGSTDASFNLTTIPDQDDQLPDGSRYEPRRLIIQPDNRILAVGVRTQIRGTAAFLRHDGRIWRLNANGGLDTGFGSNGRTSLNSESGDLLPSGFGGINLTTALGQPDGKLVVAGSYLAGPLFVARLNGDGTLDSTFGTNGVYREPSNPLGNAPQAATAVALQGDGKLLVSTSGGTSGLTRFNTNGTLDSTFGVGGHISTTFGNQSFTVRSLAVQSNGNIAGAGADAGRFGVARWTTGGLLDITFGSGGDGRVTTSFASDYGAADVLIQPDGKIVVAGTMPDGAITLARYNANGTLDSTFGNAASIFPARTGSTSVSFTSFVHPVFTLSRVLRQSDGRIIVVAGYHDTDSLGNTTSGVSVSRFTVDGDIDATFGTSNGVKTSEIAFAGSATLLANGNLVLCGSKDAHTVPNEAYTSPTFVVVEVTPAGTLDTSFGTNGVATLSLDAGIYAPHLNVTSVAVQSNQKIVVGGISNYDNGGTAHYQTYDFVFARFNANGSVDTAFGQNGVARQFAGITFSSPFPDSLSRFVSRPDGSLLALASVRMSTNSSGGELRGLEIAADGTFRQAFALDASIPAQDIVRQADGRLVVASGTTAALLGQPATTPQSIARLNSDGTRDTMFGTNGVAATTFSDHVSGMRAVAIQADGKIIAVGSDGGSFAVARYFGVPGFQINPAPGGDTPALQTTEAGGTATFTVSLTDVPTANVTIALSSSDTTEGTVSPASLTFTPTNFAAPQTVTITGVDDTLHDADQFYSIVTGAAVSTDANFNGLNPADVPAVNIDNETARMFRAYNPNANFHFFTTSRAQFDNAVAAGYHDEASNRGGFAVLPTQETGSTSLFRLYNLERGFHYYTLNPAERNYLVSLVPPPATGPDTRTTGWRDEGSEGFMFPTTQTGTTVIYRLYNTDSGVHLFTENAAVRDAILGITEAGTGRHPWQRHDDVGFAYAISGPQASQAEAAAAALAWDSDGVRTASAVFPVAVEREASRAGDEPPVPSVMIEVDSASPPLAAPFPNEPDSRITRGVGPREASDGTPAADELDEFWSGLDSFV